MILRKNLTIIFSIGIIFGIVALSSLYLYITTNCQVSELFQQQLQDIEYSTPILKDNSLRIELVTEGLSFPTSMAFLDKNNILVLEKNKGTVRLVSNGILYKNPVLKVNSDGKNERGLLGIAKWKEKGTEQKQLMSMKRDIITNDVLNKKKQ